MKTVFLIERFLLSFLRSFMGRSHAIWRLMEGGWGCSRRTAKPPALVAVRHGKAFGMPYQPQCRDADALKNTLKINNPKKLKALRGLLVSGLRRHREALSGKRRKKCG